MKKIAFATFCSLFIFACQTDNTPKLNPMNLLQHGIPMTIMAPDSADVKTSDLGLFKNVTIQKGKDFYIEVFYSTATTTDIGKIKADQLEEVRSEQYFSQILTEEDDGFTYETEIDSLKNYGFRYMKVQGDNEYIFRPGFSGFFTLEEAERMYNAVKQE